MKENLNFIKISFNIYVETILRLLAVYINTYMISRYDFLLLGALSAANQIFIISSTMIGFLSVGTSVFISQSLGAKKKNLVIKATHISLFFNFFVGFLCFVLSYFNAFNILKVLNVSSDIFQHSYIYLKTISVVIFIDSLYIAFSGVIRVYARTFELMIVAIVMNCVNISLNALFLFYYELGLFGVGISSIISRLIALILLIFIYLKVLKLRVYFGLMFKLKLEIFKKIIKIGSFNAAQNLLGSIQYLVIFSYIAILGSKYLSIQTVYFQISMFIVSFSISISAANRIIIGRFIGKKDFDLAFFHTKKALKYAIFFNILALVFVFSISKYILLALNLSPELQNIIKPLFYVSFILEIARAVNTVISGALNASADAAFVFYTSAICMWLIGVPSAYFLAIKFELALLGIWLAFSLEEIFRAILNIKRWQSKKWQNKVLV